MSGDGERNFIAFLIKLHFLGEFPNQKNTPAMRLVEVGLLAWIEQLGLVKSFPFIPNGDANRALVETRGDVDLFLSIIPIPVDDGVDDGFIQRQSDAKLGIVVKAMIYSMIENACLNRT